MKKLDIYNQPSRVLVRCSHSEQETWRRVFPMDALHVFVTVGDCLDAKNTFPAGSMKNSQGEVMQTYCFRD